MIEEVAVRVLEKIVEQRCRQPVVSESDVAADVKTAWLYAEEFMKQKPPPQSGGF